MSGLAANPASQPGSLTLPECNKVPLDLSYLPPLLLRLSEQCAVCKQPSFLCVAHSQSVEDVDTVLLCSYCQ